MRPDLEPLWEAFNNLSTERISGMSIGPIPYHCIRDYVRIDLGLEGDLADDAIAIIRIVDSEFMSLINEEQSTALKAQKGSASSGAGPLTKPTKPQGG